MFTIKNIFLKPHNALKQVFTKKQFYSDIKGLPERLNEMTFDKYGLKKWEDFKDTLKNIKIDKTITKRNADELFTPIKGTKRMGFKDYMDRGLVITKTTFNRHKKRAELFPHVKTGQRQFVGISYLSGHKIKI